MPIQQTSDGKWRYGERGKKYDRKADALRQMRAVHARRRTSTTKNEGIEMGMNPAVPLMTGLLGETAQQNLADMGVRFGPMSNLPPIEY